MIPRLIIVIPCYNEQEVLPITAPQFLAKINQLAAEGLISGDSRVMFVNDGSKDDTWNIIQQLADQDEHYIGISWASARAATADIRTPCWRVSWKRRICAISQ